MQKTVNARKNVNMYLKENVPVIIATNGSTRLGEIPYLTKSNWDMIFINSKTTQVDGQGNHIKIQAAYQRSSGKTDPSHKNSEHKEYKTQHKKCKLYDVFNCENKLQQEIIRGTTNANNTTQMLALSKVGKKQGIQREKPKKKHQQLLAPQPVSAPQANGKLPSINAKTQQVQKDQDIFSAQQEKHCTRRKQRENIEDLVNETLDNFLREIWYASFEKDLGYPKGKDYVHLSFRGHKDKFRQHRTKMVQKGDDMVFKALGK